MRVKGVKMGRKAIPQEWLGCLWPNLVRDYGLRSDAYHTAMGGVFHTCWRTVGERLRRRRSDARTREQENTHREDENGWTDCAEIRFVAERGVEVFVFHWVPRGPEDDEEGLTACDRGTKRIFPLQNMFLGSSRTNWFLAMKRFEPP